MILTIQYCNNSSKSIELPNTYNNREWAKIGSRSFSPAHALTLDEHKIRPVFKYSLYDNKGNFVEGSTITPAPIAVEEIPYDKVAASVAKSQWKHANKS